MKRWMILPLAFLMLHPVAAAAQDASAPTWWVVFTEWVAPDNYAAFEAASAETQDVIAANAPEGMVYYTLFGPETGYMYAIPMEGMGDFMKLNEQWMSMVEKVGWERWRALAAKSDPMVVRRATNFFIEMPEQSYHPEGYMDALPDKPERHFDYLYPKPGMEDQFNEVMKEWVALYTDHGLDAGWTAYQAVTGEDLPMVVLITPATSRGAFYMMSEEVDKQLGDAGWALMTKTHAMMRDFRHTDARFRPELSLLPADDM